MIIEAGLELVWNAAEKKTYFGSAGTYVGLIATATLEAAAAAAVRISPFADESKGWSVDISQIRGVFIPKLTISGRANFMGSLTSAVLDKKTSNLKVTFSAQYGYDFYLFPPQKKEKIPKKDLQNTELYTLIEL